MHEFHLSTSLSFALSHTYRFGDISVQWRRDRRSSTVSNHSLLTVFFFFWCVVASISSFSFAAVTIVSPFKCIVWKHKAKKWTRKRRREIEWWDRQRVHKKELELSLTVFAPSQCGCLFDGFVWLRQLGSICIIFTTIDVDKHVKCEIYDLNGMCRHFTLCFTSHLIYDYIYTIHTQTQSKFQKRKR